VHESFLSHSSSPSNASFGETRMLVAYQNLVFKDAA
jgi:hypothetical protein